MQRCSRPSERSDRLLHAVELVYEAATDSARWPVALGAIAEELRGVSAGIRFESLRPAALRQVWVGLDPGFEKAYTSHYWRDDVWAARACKLGVGQCAPSGWLVPRDQLRRNPFYNELCVPYDLEDLVGGILERTADSLVTFAVMRPRSAEPYDAHAARRVELLMPHLQTAARVERLLGQARAESELLWAFLDRLPTGVLGLDRDGRVRRANHAAEAMLRDGLSMTSTGELTTQLSTAAGALQRCVAAARHVELGDRAPQVVRIPRPSGRAPYLVVAVPAPSDGGPAFDAGLTTLAVVTDPESDFGASAGALEREFGLTRSEARVACLVASGLAPKEIAGRIGTSWNTVRSQLRQAYAKTRTRGQSELVRLVATLGIGPAGSVTLS